MSGRSGRHEAPAPAGTWRWLERVAGEEVGAVLRSLPGPVRERVDEVPVVFERRPSRAAVRDGLDPDLLGLFTGAAFPEETSVSEHLPTGILLFLDNLYDEARADELAYRVEVRRTLLHEIGHFLGLDEEGLEARDLD